MRASKGEDKANTIRYMASTFTLRQQIEAALADRIPSALTPAVRSLRPITSVGIPSVDELLDGGLPVGAITELVGPECSGRTSFALSFLSGITQTGKVCAWIDVSNTLQPESAAAAGIQLSRLLWVRCGAAASAGAPHSPKKGFEFPQKYLIPPPIMKGLHGGGYGPHPRNEVKGLADAVAGFLRSEATAPRCAEPQRKITNEREIFQSNFQQPSAGSRKPTVSGKPWPRIEQALRVTDLLVQAGGFSAIVLDMGSIAPEYASRIPLATWFRYRAAAERNQASILLLTQHACAKSSAELVLHLQPGNVVREERTVLPGVEYRVEVTRERFKHASAKVTPIGKPPQRATDAHWHSRAAWACPR
jgi:recombination protein RecA